jgi:hypothetical protein
MKKILLFISLVIPFLISAQGIKLGTGFEVQAAVPLDTKMYVENEAEREALITYDGKLCYQADDQTWWEWSDETTEWIKFVTVNGLEDQVAVFNSDGDIIGTNGLMYDPTTGFKVYNISTMTRYLNFIDDPLLNPDGDIIKRNGQRYLYSLNQTTSFGLQNLYKGTGVINTNTTTSAFGYRNFYNCGSTNSTIIGTVNAFFAPSYPGTMDNSVIIGNQNFWFPGADYTNNSYDYTIAIGTRNGDALLNGSGDNIIIGNNLFNAASGESEVVRNVFAVGSFHGATGNAYDYALIYGDLLGTYINFNVDEIRVRGVPFTGGGGIFAEYEHTFDGQTYTTARYGGGLVVGSLQAPDSSEFLHVFGDAIVEGRFTAHEVVSEHQINLRADVIKTTGNFYVKTHIIAGDTTSASPDSVFYSLGGIKARGMVLTGTAKFKATGYTTVTHNTSASAVATIDWGASNVQHFDLNESTTLTFTAPMNPCHLTLKFIHAANTNVYTVTFPGTVLWAGGTAFNPTDTSGAIDVVTFFYDGTNYLAIPSNDFKTP